MGAYGLYELHVKAKAREQTNNFFNTLKLYSAQKLDSTANREQPFSNRHKIESIYRTTLKLHKESV